MKKILFIANIHNFGGVESMLEIQLNYLKSNYICDLLTNHSNNFTRSIETKFNKIFYTKGNKLKKDNKKRGLWPLFYFN